MSKMSHTEIDGADSVCRQRRRQSGKGQTCHILHDISIDLQCSVRYSENVYEQINTDCEKKLWIAIARSRYASQLLIENN